MEEVFLFYLPSGHPLSENISNPPDTKNSILKVSEETDDNNRTDTRESNRLFRVTGIDGNNGEGELFEEKSLKRLVEFHKVLPETGELVKLCGTTRLITPTIMDLEIDEPVCRKDLLEENFGMFPCTCAEELQKASSLFCGVCRGVAPLYINKMERVLLRKVKGTSDVQFELEEYDEEIEI